MSEYYWKLVYGNYGDLHSVMIPPGGVEVVKKRLGNGDPINLSTAVVPANQVREFEISDRPFSEQPLLEAAAQAFKEPLITETGIGSRWVKKPVTTNKWEKYYSAIPGYKYLANDGNMVIVAFRLAIHDIDPHKTPYCTESEILLLTKAS